MKGYTLSRKAHRDLFEIWLYIAKDGVEIADRVDGVIRENCELLARNPRIGKVTVEGTRRPLLSWPAHPYKNYLIFYELNSLGITIVRIVRGERDLPKMFGF